LDYVIVAIEEGKDLSSLTTNELMGSFCAYEYKMNQRNVVAVEQAFQSKVNLIDKISSSSGKACSSEEGALNFGTGKLSLSLSLLVETITYKLVPQNNNSNNNKSWVWNNLHTAYPIHCI